MIATAMIASQVTGDECIPRIVCLVMLAAITFNVFNVVTECAHETADETGAQFVTKLQQQCLDNLHGDLSYVVTDAQTILTRDLHLLYALHIAQQCRRRFYKCRILV